MRSGFHVASTKQPARSVHSSAGLLILMTDPCSGLSGKGGRISCGPLTPDSVARIVQQAAHRAGLTGDISGHSLRSGHVTTAARAGVPELTIMRQTGHRSVATLRKYIRKGELFTVNGATKLGL